MYDAHKALALSFSLYALYDVRYTLGYDDGQEKVAKMTRKPNCKHTKYKVFKIYCSFYVACNTVLNFAKSFIMKWVIMYVENAFENAKARKLNGKTIGG